MCDQIRLLLAEETRGDRPPSVLRVTKALKENFTVILDSKGLEEATVDVLIDLFISEDLEFTHELRSAFLEALVVDGELSLRNVEMLLYWCFSKVYTDVTSVAIVYNWIYLWAKYKLIDIRILEKMHSTFFCHLKVDKLVTPICNILTLMKNPKLVLNKNISILKKLYDLHPKDIGKVLYVYNSLNPVVGFKNKVSSDDKPSDYEVLVKKIGVKLGFSANGEKVDEKHILEAPVYKSSASVEMGLPKISEISNPYELGKNIELLVHPDNETSLLSSDGGVMYLFTKGPTKKFLDELSSKLSHEPTYPLLASIVGLQKQLMYGLPPVTDYLSRFLIVWDGNYNDQIVYNLIPWLRFETFDELKNKILIPLSRVFISSPTNVKIELIDSLSALIQNMVSIHMEKHMKMGDSDHDPLWLKSTKSSETVVSLIDFVHKLITFGVAKEGLRCTSLIYKALQFYHKMVDLQLRYTVIYFYIPPKSVFYGAMASINLATLNSLCSLITRCKEEVVSFIKTIDDSLFETEIQSLNEYSTELYSYIWADNENIHAIAAMEGEKTLGRYHLAIYPFIQEVFKSLNKDSTNVTKEDRMEIFKEHAKGIAGFIKLVEKENEEEDMMNHSELVEPEN